MTTIKGFWFSPTYKCNNRCKRCYAGGKLTLKQEATLPDAQRYLDEMAKAGAKTCILVGGEPTVYPFISEVVQFGARLGLEMKIMSNGRRLADRNFARRLKQAGLAYCSISLEGLEPVHELITEVKGSFAQSVQGIRN